MMGRDATAASMEGNSLMIAPALVGTDKQIKWAAQIIEQKQQLARGEGITLPDIPDVRFWIDNRNAALDTLLKNAARYQSNPNKVSTPFTSRYPRYGPDDARAAL